MTALFYSWPVFALAATTIYVVWGMSGSLRVWPEAFSADSISRGVYNFRKNFVDSKNISGAATGVVVGSLVALLTWLLS